MSKIYLLLIAFIFYGFVGLSQVTADFTSNATIGCNPFTVNFTSTSTGSISNYSWDFGNGLTSTLQNPTIQYTGAGTYTVSLTVTENGTGLTDTKTITNYITVVDGPTVNFNISGGAYSGCVPYTGDFNDLSTLGDAPLNNWYWDFGDGTVNNGTNSTVSHDFTNPGVYNIFLRVTDTNGCFTDTVINALVSVSTPPVIDFTADKTQYCSVPVLINFTNNTSTYVPASSYSWDFGDGNTSTQENPSNTYNSLGVYDVSLTVTDQFGCSNSDTFTNYINLNQVTASFNFIPNDTVFCAGTSVGFQNTSGINCSWFFGDGGGIANTSAPTIYHTYNFPGTYTVTMIAAPGDMCADTITQDITVESVNANFSSYPNYDCKDSLNVSFTDSSSSNVVSWLWLFGDGDSAFVQNPQHIFANEGSYSDTLIVTTANGCTATYVIPNDVLIQHPTAAFTMNVNKGCVPLDVIFTDNSTSNEPINSWQWVFDNGTPSTASGTPVTSTFDSTGEWYVQLIIINNAGCTDTVVDTVKVGSPQQPDFTISKDTACASDTISFHNLSVDTNLIDSYDWQFSTDFEPSEVYVYNDNVASDTGYADIQLITDYNGCKDTLKIDSMLYVQGPIVKSINLIHDCDNPYDFVFYADIVDGEYWNWSFGDGTVINSSTSDTVTHTFTDRGTYWIKVEAYNNTRGCDFKDSLQIKVTDLIGDLQVSQNHCTGSVVPFNATATQDANSYFYDFGDGNTYGWYNIPFTNHTYSNSGIYNVSLIVSDIYNCTDTIRDTIVTSTPVAYFTADTTMGCSPFIVNFNCDSSSSEFGINTYAWNFHDGTPILSDSINPQHYYTSAGNFYAQLTITDSVNCTATYGVVITSYAVNANIIGDTTICANQNYQFFADSSVNYSYNWNFANGQTDTINNPYVSFTNDSVYNLCLIVNDTHGCLDTAYQKVYVQDINVNLQLIDSIIDCYTQTPINDTIIHNATDDVYTPQWSWSFGDGSYSTVQYPTHSYTQPAYYWVSLQATTPYGCVDKDSVRLNVFGPYGVLVLDKDTLCKGEQLSLSLIDTSNVVDLLGVLGDGAVFTVNPYLYSYNSVGQKIIDVSLYSDNNHTCVMHLPSDTVFVREVISDFEVYDYNTLANDTANCSPFTVGFYNYSQGADTWVWSYSDGTSLSGNLPPPHTFENNTNNDSIFNVQLIVSDNIGCTDTLTKQIIVYGKPKIILSNDTTICRYQSVNLTASGGNSIIWSPNEFIDDTTSYNVTVNPDSSQKYYIEVIDTRQCKNTDSVTVLVQQVPNVNYSNDTTIIIGEIAPLYIFADQNNVSYMWSPDYEIDCINCEQAIAKPLQTTTYTIIYEDSLQCFDKSVNILVNVKEAYSLDLPNTFTPNGDGNNDIVYVRGWGIKQLLEFKIFNRWGEMVFFTDDLKKGWDGTYKGKPQNIDTYAYYVKVLLYNGSVRTKKGTINIVR